MKILMLSLPWFGIIYYIVNKDKDYRMKKTFYKLLIFLTLLCLIALIIVSNYNKGSKLEGYEKECYYYCDISICERTPLILGALSLPAGRYLSHEL